MTGKDPRRQMQGAISKAKGQAFERRLDGAFRHYDEMGFALIEKTPEPLRVTRRLTGGKVEAFFEKRAQPDYKGTIRGGRAVVFEAKFTSSSRLEQSRVLEEQGRCLDKHQQLGAKCFIIAGYSGGGVYRIPWDVWKAMKERFGRKYITEADLQIYRVPVGRNGVPLILD